MDDVAHAIRLAVDGYIGAGCEVNVSGRQVNPLGGDAVARQADGAAVQIGFPITATARAQRIGLEQQHVIAVDGQRLPTLAGHRGPAKGADDQPAGRREAEAVDSLVGQRQANVRAVQEHRIAAGCVRPQGSWREAHDVLRLDPTDAGRLETGLW